MLHSFIQHRGWTQRQGPAVRGVEAENTSASSGMNINNSHVCCTCFVISMWCSCRRLLVPFLYIFRMGCAWSGQTRVSERNFYKAKHNSPVSHSPNVAVSRTLKGKTWYRIIDISPLNAPDFINVLFCRKSLKTSYHNVKDYEKNTQR